MRKFGFRSQRTLARPATVTGRGLLSGAAVKLRFQPAPPSTGVVFVRADRPSPNQVPARVGFVTNTARRTTLGADGVEVTLVEHVLAALAGLRIDNCYVELDGVEPPGLDGSAGEFVDALLDAGCVIQAVRRPIWCVAEPLTVSKDRSTITLYPASGPTLLLSYLLDYGPTGPIAFQRHTQTLTPLSFADELADCRTFILEEEAAGLRRQGIGQTLTTKDLVVFGPHGPLDTVLRWANEPARHKMLDLIGDLSLFGFDVAGHLVAYRSGHPLNVELVRALMERLCTYNSQPERYDAAVRRAA